MGEDDRSNIRFAIAQETLLWQSISWRIGENRLTPSSLIAFGIPKWIKESQLRFDDDPFTSDKKIGELSSSNPKVYEARLYSSRRLVLGFISSRFARRRHCWAGQLARLCYEFI